MAAFLNIRRRRGLGFSSSRFHLSDQSKKVFGSVKILLMLIFSIIVLSLLVREIYLGIRYSVWDGKRQLTFVFEQNNHVGYFKVYPALNEVIILTFPDNTMIHLSSGYGDLRADKIKLLAVQEKNNFGSLLTASMTQYLGQLTDGYIINATGTLDKPEALLQQALLRRAKTHFTDWDLIRLLLFISNLSTEQIKVIALDKTGALQQTQMPDKSEIFQAETDTLDEFVLRELANPDFLSDKLTWEIFNGTDHTGLGSDVKRIIANSGLDVIGVRQAQDKFAQSAIQTSTENSKNENVKVIARYFNLPVTTTMRLSERAEVTFIIGEDFWKKYYER